MRETLRKTFATATMAVCLTPLLALAKDVARAPVPDEGELKSANTIVDEIYKDEISKAKTASEKVAVAQKMIGAAAESKPAGKFVLLTMARDLASDAGNADVCLAAVDELAKVFEVDTLTMKTETLARSGRMAPPTAEAQVALVEAADGVILQALAADRYDSARTLASMAYGWARRAREVALMKRADDRAREVRQAQAAHAQVRRAIAVLAEKPDDAAANLAVGKYLCFVKGEWDKGLPLLKVGTDVALKTLATKDLAKPTAQNEVMALADAWWDYAETQRDLMQSRVQYHAAEIYRRALPDATGLAKLKAEKRIAQAGSLPVGIDVQPARGMIPGMIGMVEVSGKPTGILFRYRPGMVFKNTTVQETLQANGYGTNGIKIILHGSLMVPQDMTALFWQRGGSSSGGVHRLHVDNAELGSIGDDRVKNSVYRAKLRAGVHAVRWTLTGGHFGDSLLKVFLEDGSKELPITCPTRYWEKPKARVVVDNFHEGPAGEIPKVPE